MKDIYQTYDAVQLAADDAFIRWVKVGALEDEAGWQNWLDRHPERRPVVEEARRLVKGLVFKPEKPKVDTDQLWNRIKTSSREPAIVKPIGSRRRFLYGIGGAVAAAIALVLFMLFGVDRPQQIRTQFGEHIAHVLPDQSKVQINADSRMWYNDSGRRVELQGEAYFEVEKGGDFIVETALGQVQVLGTQFNVYSRDDRFEVQCTEGRVRVTVPSDSEGVILTPGSACELTDSGKLVRVELSGLEAEVDWIRDFHRFKDQTLKEFFEEIERQFDVRVRASQAILSRPHTGFFEGGDLEKALEDNIVYTQKLAYEIDGKNIRITE